VLSLREETHNVDLFVLHRPLSTMQRKPSVLPTRRAEAWRQDDPLRIP